MKFHNSNHWAAKLQLEQKREADDLKSAKLSTRSMAKVAFDVANGMSYAKIAEKHGIRAGNIGRWLKRPGFARYVDRVRADLLRQQQNIGIAAKHVRLAHSQRDYSALQRVMEERQMKAEKTRRECGEDSVEPGESTGIMTRRIRAGGHVETVIDRELIEMMRMLREEAAIETGDRDKDRKPANVTVVVEYVEEGKDIGPGITVEDRLAAIEAAPCPADSSRSGEEI